MMPLPRVQIFCTGIANSSINKCNVLNQMLSEFIHLFSLTYENTKNHRYYLVRRTIQLCQRTWPIPEQSIIVRQHQFPTAKQFFARSRSLSSFTQHDLKYLPELSPAAQIIFSYFQVTDYYMFMTEDTNCNQLVIPS